MLCGTRAISARSVGICDGVPSTARSSYVCRNFKFNANSVDPDQTPHFVVSDLGPHCLPMSLLWDTRLKWVKIFIITLSI